RNCWPWPERPNRTAAMRFRPTTGPLATNKNVTIYTLFFSDRRVLFSLFTTDAASESRAGLHALPSGEEEGEANKRQFRTVANDRV
ncbi:MAG: hypothetical protein K2K83_06235, partial [Rikenella sp.]|nr:hypothetical protein [Rikenella sp.]